MQGIDCSYPRTPKMLFSGFRDSAAAITCPTIGLFASGCSGFGRAEFMRVPLPAARMMQASLRLVVFADDVADDVIGFQVPPSLKKQARTAAASHRLLQQITGRKPGLTAGICANFVQKKAARFCKRAAL